STDPDERPETGGRGRSSGGPKFVGCGRGRPAPPSLRSPDPTKGGQMGQETFEKGLHEIGDGTYAYLLPNGSWGWSNAGLIVDGEATLLVDTLYTLGLTGEMLTEMRRRVPAAERIDTLVNSHADGD